MSSGGVGAECCGSWSTEVPCNVADVRGPAADFIGGSEEEREEEGERERDERRGGGILNRMM